VALTSAPRAVDDQLAAADKQLWSRALELFPNGRGDEDEALPLSAADDPLPRGS
jgi:hypothetical protein